MYVKRDSETPQGFGARLSPSKFNFRWFLLKYLLCQKLMIKCLNAIPSFFPCMDDWEYIMLLRAYIMGCTIY